MSRLLAFALIAFALLAPSAQASPYARATLQSCDRQAHEAAFDGRVTAYRGATRMQLRFTLQVRAQDERRWRKVTAPGWGDWISAPSNLARYTYTKRVQELLAPARYRAVVNFRWRDARGRIIRRERAVSPSCRLPDERPDLEVRSVRFFAGLYRAVIFNRGRQAAGPFAVDFLADGRPLGRVEIAGLEPKRAVTALLDGPPCAPGTLLEAIADARSQVDEADEFNDAETNAC